MSKAKVLDKIRKLLALAHGEGATPSEVENALAQAEKLRTKYQIDINELEISPNDIDYEYLLMDTKSFEPKHWISKLCSVIAFGYNCKLIKNVKANGKIYMRIIGFTEDVEMCENAIFNTKVIVREMADIQWKINGKEKTFRHNYILGFVEGLDERLKAERKDKFVIEEQAQKYDLIVYKKDALIEGFISQNFNNIKQGRRTTSYITNAEAFHTGRKDGAQRNYNTKALKN